MRAVLNRYEVPNDWEGERMAGKRSRIKRRQCVGKVAHRTRAQAEMARKALYRNAWTKGIVPAKLDVYKCENCGLFHVGHSKKVQREQ